MNINFSSKFYLVLVLLSSFLITWVVFVPGFFFHHDDLQVMRIFEMRKCFNDLQIPCRWVPDMGYGNGFPLFNYYSALPYYIGASLSYFLSFVDSAKALFFIPLVLGAVAMFYLSQKLFGKEAGFLSAILYSFAPYRALDSYVRGAVAESFAIAIIPLVFYFILEIIEKPSKRNLILGSLSLGAFLLCHNIMTLFFMPFLIIWIFLFLYLKRWKNWKPVLVSLILGTGVSAFFLFPAFLEKDLVQSESLISVGGSFRTHFVGVGQLFLDRSWGYGGSVFGPNDTISFQIGWPLWWFVVAVLPVLLFVFKKNLKLTLVAIYFLIIFLISVFMMHNKSAFVWEAITTLQYAQFPWRFLSLSIFSAAVLAGFVVHYLNLNIKNLVVWVVAIAAIFLNWNFFQPREFYPWINDQRKLADPLWEIQQKAGILDYLPITAQEPPSRAINSPDVLNGSAQTSNYNVYSNRFSFDTKVIETAFIQVPVFDFPNWTIYANGKEIPHQNKSSWGRISFEIPPGDYKITGILENTPVRTISNILSAISAVFILLIWFNKKIFKLLT